MRDAALKAAAKFRNALPAIVQGPRAG